jgi:hypothetical protein
MSIELIAASVRPYENQFDLENAVFEAVCNADPDVLEAVIARDGNPSPSQGDWE